ncbi:MAG: hypothetical protein K6C30_03660, partial [Bacteroidaceae bacterium]|nr:hypothetical protein [Bacteroidaceae bacterium]
AYRYAATKLFTTDESGKKTYKYKHWGTLDESNRFHPGMSYNYASPAALAPPPPMIHRATVMEPRK